MQDVPRLARDPAVKVWLGDENRVILIGLDEAREKLLYADVKGRNPFKDRRVRLAMYQAIDIETMRRQVIPWVTRAGVRLTHRANNVPLVYTIRMP